jgi:hypothetical protein
LRRTTVICFWQGRRRSLPDPEKAARVDDAIPP